MPRYIDADIAINAFYEMASDTDHLCTVSDYVKFLESMSDAVEIVRCKDCKWYDMTDPCGTLTPNAHRCKRVARLWMEDDAYCSYGERRNDENRRSC